jgi:esterase/lipase superfamily enzyme
MPSRNLVAIKNDLIRFFQSLVKNKSVKINASTNVRKACGISNERRWQALAKQINKIPSILAARITIAEKDMSTTTSVAEIAAKLCPIALVTARSGLVDRRKPINTGPIVVQTEAKGAEYVVWYGTNRMPIDAADLSRGYSKERDNTTHYGSCRVFVPKSHKIGSVGSSWWKRLISNVDDRLKLLGIKELEEEQFWENVRDHLRKTAVARRDVVIFIHGYNVSFSQAAIRAAQIGFDLSMEGVMAFFSWPSQGILKGYVRDEATIEASEVAIADFIEKFSGERRRVHLIAHSMGNRGVLRAVDRIVNRAKKRRTIFGQIILAAADVDVGTFRNLCGGYVQTSNRATLYVSSKDRAVEASRWLHDFPRAGLLPPVMIVPGIDTINVVNSDISMLGHGYVAEARGVLQDMHALITAGTPPDERFGLRRSKTGNGELYWTIGK